MKCVHKCIHTGQTNIVNIVKSRRLQYAGHIARMDQERIPKRVMKDGMVGGRRFPGRPRRRWMDNVKEDLDRAGADVHEWITVAQDRRDWRQLVLAVRGQQVARPPPE